MGKKKIKLNWKNWNVYPFDRLFSCCSILFYSFFPVFNLISFRLRIACTNFGKPIAIAFMWTYCSCPQTKTENWNTFFHIFPSINFESITLYLRSRRKTTPNNVASLPMHARMLVVIYEYMRCVNIVVSRHNETHSSNEKFSEKSGCIEKPLWRFYGE